MEPLRVDGKFFRAGERRIGVRAVTYGPFPGGWPADLHADFAKIAAAGFNALRLYSMPGRDLLDAALAHGLRVFAMPEWPQAFDFFRDGQILAAARVALTEGLRPLEGHPALAGVYVANEIPADLVRWMGPAAVLRALEDLIDLGREIRPDILWSYASYPSTEYLEPANADFTAFNVYLEHPVDFRHYLRRLHHLAGDRPVMISEFGLDSRRNGTARQADTLAWAVRIAAEMGMAGMTLFAWSDRWFANGEVTDWDFGLTDREGREKPALAAVSSAWKESERALKKGDFSVIVCTRNGSSRIAACLAALERQTMPVREVIVVDDGSTDRTADLVAQRFPKVRLVKLPPSGLSAARNAGAEAASGTRLAFTDDDCEPDPEWLAGLAASFEKGWDVVGGPNLPPPARNAAEAVVAAAPGAPSHVMLDDEEAEHLPGCNLAVTRTAFFDVGGFDPAFTTAGDDVDFCWRLRDRGFRLGFAPTAFVWHHRRGSLAGYLRQQIGYGKAEALLIDKHPHRFTTGGDARWEGFVYAGGPIRAVDGSVIYHGTMGLAGYQGVIQRMQPRRPIDPRFVSTTSTIQLAGLEWLQPRLRSWFRCRRWKGPESLAESAEPPPDSHFSLWCDDGGPRADFLQLLLDDGWQPGGATDGWDVEKSGTRLQIAIERGKAAGAQVLVRAWGDGRAAEARLRELFRSEEGRR